jgi:hypothetical protein
MKITMQNKMSCIQRSCIFDFFVLGCAILEAVLQLGRQQLATCKLPDNPITTAIQLATNCCRSSATVADMWQAH